MGEMARYKVCLSLSRGIWEAFRIKCRQNGQIPSRIVEQLMLEWLSRK